MRSAGVCLLAAIAVALGAAWACLPDLQLTPPAPFCGDGVIDPDAGEQCDPGDAALTSSVCVSCTVQCVGGELPFLDPVSHHCYFSTSPQNTLKRAGGACEEAGAHVVRFVSENEVALVMNKAPSDPFWVGLERQSATAWGPAPESTTEPGWSSSCPGCYADVDAGAAEIPLSPADAGGNCVVSTKVLADPWTQSLCAGSRVTICEREPIGTRATPCGGNGCITVAATESHKRYVLLDRKLGASDAVQSCAGVGGKLVVFGSREEREQLGEQIGAQSIDPAAHDFWIGLSTDANGSWRWDSPGGMGVLPWGVAQPAAVASGTGRAYVTVGVGAFDSELARAGDAADGGSGEQHHAVCELSR